MVAMQFLFYCFYNIKYKPSICQIWSELLSMEKQFVGLEWKQQLSEKFAERLQAVSIITKKNCTESFIYVTLI